MCVLIRHGLHGFHGTHPLLIEANAHLDDAENIINPRHHISRRLRKHKKMKTVKSVKSVPKKD